MDVSIDIWSAAHYNVWEMNWLIFYSESLVTLVAVLRCWDRCFKFALLL